MHSQNLPSTTSFPIQQAFQQNLCFSPHKNDHFLQKSHVYNVCSLEKQKNFANTTKNGYIREKLLRI